MLAEGIYNQRKLQELPFNLIHALRFDAFVREICSNFEWLYAKIKTVSMDEVLFDLNLALKVIQEFRSMTIDMETDSLSASSLIEFGQGFIKSKTAAEECEFEVRSLKDAFTLNRDSIRKDVNHLPVAVRFNFFFHRQYNEFVFTFQKIMYFFLSEYLLLILGFIKNTL